MKVLLLEGTLTVGLVRSRCLAMSEVPLCRPTRFKKGGELEIDGSISLPADARPSFRGEPTRICWMLGVVVDLPGWPDLEEVREVFVQPESRR